MKTKFIAAVVLSAALLALTMSPGYSCSDTAPGLYYDWEWCTCWPYCVDQMGYHYFILCIDLPNWDCIPLGNAVVPCEGTSCPGACFGATFNAAGGPCQ